MRHLILVFLVIGSVMIFFSCQEESVLDPELSQVPEISQSDQVPVSLAKAKPSPNLTGKLYGLFNFPPLPDPDGSDLPIFWKGTITFGEDIVGIYFLSHGAPRDYSQATPFYEEHVIYNLADPTIVYLKGWNAGVMTFANRDPDPVKFRANGKIEEAYGPFAEWQDCNVHISGLVYWVTVGLPKEAVAIYRIN